MAVSRAAVTSYSAQRMSLEGMCLQAYGRTSPWQVRLQMQYLCDSVAMVASCLSPGWKAWSKQSQDGARVVLFAPQAHRVKQQRIWRGMSSTLRGGGGRRTCDLQSLDFDLSIQNFWVSPWNLENASWIFKTFLRCIRLLPLLRSAKCKILGRDEMMKSGNYDHGWASWHSQVHDPAHNTLSLDLNWYYQTDSS